MRRSPRRILRWLGRFLWWSFVTVAASVVLVGIIAVIAYINRVRIVNEALALLAAPYQVTVDEIHIRELGVARLEGLTLSPKHSTSEEPTIRVPEAEITYDFGTLRKTRQLKALTLREPSIVVDERLFPEAAKTKDSDEKFDLSSLAYFTDAVVVEDGTFRVTLERFPEIVGKWEFQSSDLSFAEDGMLEKPFEAVIEDIRIGKEDSGNTVKRAEMTVSANRNLTRFEVPQVTIDRPTLTVTPEWLGQQGPPTKDSKDEDSSTNTMPDIFFDVVEVIDADLSLESFATDPDTPSIPDLGFLTDLSWENLSLEKGRWDSEAPLTWTAREIAIGTGTSQFLSADSVTVNLTSLSQLVHNMELEEVSIATPEVILSDATMQTFEGTENAEEEDDTSDGIPLVIKKGSISDGRFLMQDYSIDGSAAPRVQAAVSGTLEDLRLGGESAFDSAGDQAVLLRQFRFWAPEAAGATPLLKFDEAELTLNWSDFSFDNTIDRLSIRSPEINFTDDSLGSWLHPTEPEEDTPRPLNRPVYKARDLVVTDGSLIADTKFSEGLVPKIIADFTIATQEDSDSPFSYLITLKDLVLKNHAVSIENPEAPQDPTLFPEQDTPDNNPIAESEVVTIREVEVETTAEEIQRNQRIGRVKLSGAVLRVGEGLKSMVDTAPAEEEEPDNQTDAPEPELPTWTIDKLQVTQSQVRFEALIPQVEGLEFGIETTLENLPLSPDGLLAQDKLQKVELAGIEIKDPYNSFITVAFLPTIFVEFSLAGLAKQEVEKIDLISPSLYVGQGLFWWVDYQRKFREQNEGASVGLDSESETNNSPDWIIKTINANAGKIVIAPTGVPIGMVPFPFNATTNMKDGGIELKLNIPDEDYVYKFPEYKVNLYGLTGDIQFNVPVEQVSNNLVQTFSLDKAVWKEYEAEDLYLSVTFDADGIYGQFGGDAYDGYAEGQFNFYLNDKGKWDAWIAGTDMDTGGITDVVAPENFKMEGDVSLKIVSEGRGKSLGETTGEFHSTSPGWFDVTKLDAILENLPEEWTNLQKALTELGLIALKRFDYDKGAGSLYLQGREGDLQLRFDGPYGVRELNLFLHDQRNQTSLTDRQ